MPLQPWLLALVTRKWSTCWHHLSFSFVISRSVSFSFPSLPPSSLSLPRIPLSSCLSLSLPLPYSSPLSLYLSLPSYVLSPHLSSPISLYLSISRISLSPLLSYYHISSLCTIGDVAGPPHPLSFCSSSHDVGNEFCDVVTIGVFVYRDMSGP